MMNLRSLAFKVQMYISAPEGVNRLGFTPNTFSVLGMVPGQKYEVAVSFPNRLRIGEIAGASEGSIIMAGRPENLYICDGVWQYEYSLLTPSPEVSPAPPNFDALNASLPCRLLLNYLLSSSALQRTMEAEEKPINEYWCEGPRVSYRVQLDSGNYLPSNVSGFAKFGEPIGRHLVEMQYSEWEVNVALPQDIFLVEPNGQAKTPNRAQI